MDPMALSPKENLLRAIRYDRPDHVPYAGEGAYALVDYRGRRPPLEGTDEWGVTWAPLPASYVASEEEPALSYPAVPAARSVQELLGRPCPSATDPALYQGLLQGVDPAQALVIGQHPAGPLDRLVALLGMERAMLALLREPDATQAVLDRIANYHGQVARGYLAAGAEAGWLADDYAGASGPFLDLRLWRRLILPGLAQVIAIYRQAGAPVFFHTCGQASAFVPDLLEAGVTVFNLESAACDLAALKARFGRRIAFLGGVAASVMLHGTPADVREAARHAILTLGRDGGLILAPDQPLAFPRANREALREAARAYGRYPLAI